QFLIMSESNKDMKSNMLKKSDDSELRESSPIEGASRVQGAVK
ncbi:985_t:CDS:2, partial [Paraglomus brasilianum]